MAKNHSKSFPKTNADIEQMIRVNHAGEYGAIRIYKGQIAALKNSAHQDILRHMYDQEKAHLKMFEELIIERKVRPTALSPLWHVAGYLLGYATGLMGEKAAMACTVAVEEVIDEHYKEQENCLKSDEKKLKKVIQKCRADEQDHRDIGLSHGAEETPGYRTLTHSIKTASKLAIWLSKRL
jgi:ubiquinone biosynthesis monooxygenase Coq7